MRWPIRHKGSPKAAEPKAAPLSKRLLSYAPLLVLITHASLGPPSRLTLDFAPLSGSGGVGSKGVHGGSAGYVN